MSGSEKQSGIKMFVLVGVDGGVDQRTVKVDNTSNLRLFLVTFLLFVLIAGQIEVAFSIYIKFTLRR